MAEDSNNMIERKQEKRPSVEERRKDLKQFNDVRQAKKKEPNAFWNWIAKMFFSGKTMKEICKEVAEDVLIPGIKDNVRNALVNTIDMKIYEDHNTSATTSGTPGSFITNYVSSYDKKKQQKAALEANQKKEAEVIKSGFEYPAFRSKKQADDFLMSMHAYVQKYETMSVQDLAWMQGKSIDFTWDAYGWQREEILDIKAPKHINNPETPWVIMLPKAHEFD
jgi:hypothetical protein